VIPDLLYENMSATTTSPTNVFSVSFQGQIESSVVQNSKIIQIPLHDNLYCKFAFGYGPDWTVLTVLKIANGRD
jgi:hypothetical protein